MADLQGIAQQIRDLIHAQAPASVDEIVKGLPDEAVVAAGPAALVIVLIMFFMIVGALTGGKKKKAKRAQIEEVDDDDIPAPIVPRATPPRAPEPVAKEADAKLDRRGEALLEAIKKARPPEADLPSAEQILAQQQAAARVVRDNPGALKFLMGGDVNAGFQKLAEEAASLERANRVPKAVVALRDLSVLAEGIDNKIALQAAEDAFAHDQSDFWGAIFLARLRSLAQKRGETLVAAQAAQAAAKSLREKAIAQVEIGDAYIHLAKYPEARPMYQGAVDTMRTLARGGEKRAQHDLSVCLNKLGDLEVVFKDFVKAKALFEEDLTIARHLAKANPTSIEAGRDVMISMVKLADITQDRPMFAEALALGEQLHRDGRLPVSDAWMLDAIRKALAGAPTA